MKHLSLLPLIPLVGFILGGIWGIVQEARKKRKRTTWMQEIARRRGISEEQLMQEIETAERKAKEML